MRFVGLAFRERRGCLRSGDTGALRSRRSGAGVLMALLALGGCGRIGFESVDVNAGLVADGGGAGSEIGPAPGGRLESSTGGEAGTPDSLSGGTSAQAGSAGAMSGVGGMAGGAVGLGGMTGGSEGVGGSGGAAGSASGVGGASSGGLAGESGFGGVAGSAVLDDDDLDGVPNDEDVCPGWDDHADADGDGVPDGCDACPGSPDPVVPADWWNDQYAFRLPLTISESINGSLGSGYSVVVTLDTQSLIQSGSLLGNGDDLRVVWNDGGAQTELDRHLIGVDTASTEIWFKTQADITDSESGYAIYYGNPSAANPPARWSDAMGTAAVSSAVYLAADDFEAETAGTMPSGWEGSSAYAVALDGSNQVLEVESLDPDADYLFAGDYGWGDVVVSARVSIQDTGGDYYGLFVRAQPGTDFYAAYYGTSSDTATLQMWDMTISSPTAHSATTNFRRSTGVSPSLGPTWHTLRIAMLGQDLHFYYDAQSELFSYSVGSTRQQGRVGLCVGYADGNAYWDDVVVRAHVSPEPTAVASGSESIACP